MAAEQTPWEGAGAPSEAAAVRSPVEVVELAALLLAVEAVAEPP